MSITIHICTGPQAAEDRLDQWVAEHRLAAPDAPLQRLNILVASGLQRRYHQRRLARKLADADAPGAHAAIYFFTPTDLARQIADRAVDQASDPPIPMPQGADLLLIEDLIKERDAALALRTLHAAFPGLAEAMRVSLNDLREGRVEPAQLRAFAEDRTIRHADPDMLLDIADIYAAWTSLLGERNLADRTAGYEAAVDAPLEAITPALGGAPLAVVGLYDLTRLQRLLLKRCADAVDVSAFFAVPEDDPFAAQAIDALRHDASADIEHCPATAADSPEPVAFSAPDPLAEASELARRVIDLAERGVPFNEMAIFHREGANADQRLAYALERAGADTFVARGVPYRHSAYGRAAILLIQLLCETPTRARLLEFLGNPVLHGHLADGILRQPLIWERISRNAALTSGWNEFADLLSAYVNQLDPEREWECEPAEGLRAVCADLAARSADLAAAQSWEEAAGILADALEACVRSGSSEDEARILKGIREIINGLAEIDSAGAAFAPARARSAALTVLEHERLRARDPFRGVLIGNPAGSARTLRFDAVFVAGLAERTFPAVPREDPLLGDAARRGLNKWLGAEALRLNRGKGDHQKLQFKLAGAAARSHFGLSVARRTSVGGAQSHPSPLLLCALTPPDQPLLTSEELDERAGDDPGAQFRRLPASISGAAPLRADAAKGEWEAVLRAVDESDFRLALLGTRGIELRPLLLDLWPEGAQRALDAKVARNERRFTAYDGIVDLRGLWSPFTDAQLSATALERYARCPYQFFLNKTLGIRAVAEPDASANLSPLDRGTIMHEVLEAWAGNWIENKAQPWVEYVADPGPLDDIANSRIDRAERERQLGGADVAKALRSQMLGDLEQTRRREQVRAANGWTPLHAEWEFERVEIQTEDGGTLQVNGKVDRVDAHADGRLLAVDYKTGKFRKDAARQFFSGRALQLPIYLRAAEQRLGGELSGSSAELAYITERGEFERDAIDGADFAHPGAPYAAPLAHALGVIADGMEHGRFFPYPFREQPKQRPSSFELVCTYCDYQPICTPDVHRRYARKAKTDPETSSAFQQMHDLEPPK